MAMTRREMMVRSAVVTAAAGVGGLFGLGGRSRASAVTINNTVEAPRVLRVAHITDTHIQPELSAADGIAAAFAHIQSQPEKPDLILHTGDIIMDGFAAKRDRTQLQWNLWKSVTKANLSLPIHYALGNHDIWGWNKARSEATGNEPDYGKKWACDLLGLSKPYHSFDQGGWHFISLDSVRPFDDRAYNAYLDEEQFDWLSKDLEKTGTQTPVCVFNHIPLLSVTAYINSTIDPASTQPSSTPSSSRYRPDRGDAVVPATVQHADFRKIKNLFAKYPNVRIALSGHTHLIDRVDYNNVSYLCGGAVSANWWRGIHQNECDFGYSLLDLHADGSFTRKYVTYGWTAKK